MQALAISLVLRSAGRTSSASRERHGVRNMLVVTQVALALILSGQRGTDDSHLPNSAELSIPGFTHAEHLQIMRISIPRSLVTGTAAGRQNPERYFR